MVCFLLRVRCLVHCSYVCLCTTPSSSLLLLLLLTLAHRQMQELESRFNEAYSQSLSMKDERIQVLEKRQEDLTAANEQLKDEVTLLRRQNERLLQRRNSGGGSPSSAGARYGRRQPLSFGINVGGHVHVVKMQVAMQLMYMYMCTNENTKYMYMYVYCTMHRYCNA